MELLKRLWSEGLSASQIAGRLGSVTRNAVIGKVHRLGLSGRATTSRMKSHRPRTRLANVKRPVKPRFAQSGNPAVRALYMDAEAYVPPAEEIEIPLAERKTIQTLTRMQLPLADRRPADGRIPFLRPHQGAGAALLRGPRPPRVPAGGTAPPRAHRSRRRRSQRAFLRPRSPGPTPSRDLDGLTAGRLGGRAGGRRGKASSRGGGCWLFHVLTQRRPFAARVDRHRQAAC